MYGASTRLQDAEVPQDIRIELHRGPLAVTMGWPVAVTAQCAAWLRKLLR
jgi:transposase